MIARGFRDEPDLGLGYGQLSDIVFLKKLVQSRKAIATVAKWAHAVLIFLCCPGLSWLVWGIVSFGSTVSKFYDGLGFSVWYFLVLSFLVVSSAWELISW